MFKNQRNRSDIESKGRRHRWWSKALVFLTLSVFFLFNTLLASVDSLLNMWTCVIIKQKHESYGEMTFIYAIVNKIWQQTHNLSVLLRRVNISSAWYAFLVVCLFTLCSDSIHLNLCVFCVFFQWIRVHECNFTYRTGDSIKIVCVDKVHKTINDILHDKVQFLWAYVICSKNSDSQCMKFWCFMIMTYYCLRLIMNILRYHYGYLFIQINVSRQCIKFREIAWLWNLRFICYIQCRI